MVNPAKERQRDLITFGRQLLLTSKTMKRAEHILAKADDAELTSGIRSMSLVAAALYIACILENERRTQERISQVTGVAPSTIQRRYHDLVLKLGI